MEKYYLGLDIGTNSVGFAVTDENYNVIKKSKKYLMGVRLFEEGKTAEERRKFRSSRRRLQRKKERTKYLRSILEQPINEVDRNFFLRMDESFYHKEDKTVVQGNTLFNDKDFSDKEYHKAYPTVYHLRKALIRGEVTDYRLLYLGLEHIIKNRGHFLFQDRDLGSVSSFENVYSNLMMFLENEYEELFINIGDVQKFENILKDSDRGIKEKSAVIQTLLSEKPSAQQKSMISLMVGGKITLGSLLPDLEEEVAKVKLTLKDADETYQSVLDVLEEHAQLIEMIKTVFDWALLVDILDVPSSHGKETTISDAMIHKYYVHKEELALLKDLVNRYAKDKYREVFSSNDVVGNYVSYIGSNKKNGKKVRKVQKVCSQEDFCKYIKKVLENAEFESEKEIAFKLKLENSTLLPKLRTSDNGVIPYQVHKRELDLILENSADKFPYLLQNQEGYTVKDKILSVFMHRIPYYVGPLNRHSKEFSWVVRSDEKIYPWNFEDVVNLEESATNFIERMTNDCTYLKGKTVIPKNSLLYSKFMVLNELNNLKLNGVDIDEDTKKDIYNDLFLKEKKVTTKKLKQYLIMKSIADKTVEITGIDKEFKSSLETYIKFNKIFNGQVDNNKKMIEKIIKWIVLFSDDKKMLKNKIESEYPSEVTEDQFNKIKNLKFSGWGRLSEEFLTGIEDTNPITGEKLNIINMMFETNCNLMQLLSKEFNYLNEINELNGDCKKDTLTISDIKELYCSPAVKKSIWQTVQIVKEIERIMKGKPDKLFIEVTRAEGEKKRTTSRQKDLIEKYKAVKKEYSDLDTLLKSKVESDFRQKKLYLYFMQLGKCAYTGDKIDLEALLKSNDIYDIEHIYPRSLTKDDSIHNNLVLVKKTANAKKSDVYPIPDEFKQRALWTLWKEKKLITEEKYNRLMRVEELDAKELEGFIQRQLVETSQSSKAVAKLFEQYYGKESKVVYVKAGHVSDFRRHFEIWKLRDLNDYHHAHDAYLNIVVGNAFHTKFTEKFFNSIKTQKYSLKTNVFYSRDIKSGEYYAWKGDGESIKNVKNNLRLKRLLFTRQAYEQTGAFYDQTVYGIGRGADTPTKTGNTKLTNLDKYGGYKSQKGAYFSVVEHVIKGKVVRTIEFVPVRMANMIKNDVEKLTEYFKTQNLVEPKIVYRKLLFNSLLNIDGMPVHLSGRTDNRLVMKNATQLEIDTKLIPYIKKIESTIRKMKDYDARVPSAITVEKNISIYDLLTLKLGDSIYSIHLKSQFHSLLSLRDVFINADISKQIIAISNMFTFFKCNATKTNLSVLGGPTGAGNIRINKKINELKKLVLINQSITGFYETKVDLLK